MNGTSIILLLLNATVEIQPVRTCNKQKPFLVDNFIVHLSESETVVHLLHHICLYVQPSSGILSSPSSLLYDDSSSGLKQYGGNTHHSLTSPHISTVRMVNRASTGSSGVTACWAALHGCLDVHYL